MKAIIRYKESGRHMPTIDQDKHLPVSSELVAVRARDDLQLIANILRLESRKLEKADQNICTRTLNNVILRIDILSLMDNRQLQAVVGENCDDEMFASLFSMLMEHYEIISFSSEIDVGLIPDHLLRRGIGLMLNELLLSWDGGLEGNAALDAHLTMQLSDSDLTIDLKIEHARPHSELMESAILRSLIDQHSCKISTHSSFDEQHWKLIFPVPDSTQLN